MSEIRDEQDCRVVDTEPVELTIRVWGSGDIDIRAYRLKSKTIENLSKIVGIPIKEHGGTKWIRFAKARDKSQLVLFEE